MMLTSKFNSVLFYLDIKLTQEEDKVLEEYAVSSNSSFLSCLETS
jgi:hypothetical protein